MKKNTVEQKPNVQNDLKKIDQFFASFLRTCNQKKHEFFNFCETSYLSLILKESLLSTGKKIRPLFCFWVVRSMFPTKTWSKQLTGKVKNITLAMEIIHNASLIIDDIEDGSLKRRNKPSTHVKYGLPDALNTASWMYFIALNLLPISIQHIASKALIDCHVGQAFDLRATKNDFSKKIFFASNEERWLIYEKCVELKTSRLIHLSVELLNKVLPMKKSQFLFFKNVIQRYGMIYQIFDDLKNAFPELSGDKLYEDLKYGFRSAISIEFLNLLEHHEKSHALAQLENKKFFEFIIQHKKLKIAIKNCFFKAEQKLKEIYSFFDKNLDSRKNLEEHISALFQDPFKEIREHIYKKMELGLFE